MTDFNSTGDNQAPVLGGSTTTRFFVEGVDGAVSKIPVHNGITVSDADNATLSSAFVQILNGFVPGEDFLAFVNNNPTSFGNIQGNFNANTGVMILMSQGGTATVAQWQNALRAVTYDNASEEPTQTNRTFNIKIFDGNSESSALAFQMSVQARNDSPSGTSGVETIQENSAYVLNEADFGFSDVDGDSFDGVNVFSPVGGAFFIDADGAGPGGATMIVGGSRQLTKAEVTGGLVTFRPTAGSSGDGVASFQFVVRDNGGTTGSGRNADVTANTISFNITPVNDGPVADQDGPYAATEDTMLIVSAANGVLTGDIDPDGDPLIAVLQSGPTHGQLTLSADGSFSYKPFNNYNGTDSVT